MTVGQVKRFAFGGAVKAKGKGSDLAQDKRMVKSGIYQHETAQHGGQHEPLKLAKGGPVKPRMRNVKIEPLVVGPLSTVPVEPVVPQMYGNSAKKRVR